MKSAVYLSLMLLSACAQTQVSPGMTFLVGLDGYQNEMQRLESRPERWFDRQRAGDALKKTYLVTMGGSREFSRMVDLDLRRREFLITLRSSSVPADRAKEMKDELVIMNRDVDVLKEIIKGQVVNAEMRAQEPTQRVERAAAVGLLHLAIDAFSSMGVAAGPNPRTAKVGSYVVSDISPSHSTVRTAEGQFYRCATILVPEEGAAIRCEAAALKEHGE